ncbi:MAG TPA: transglycosylase SLT domain-containing protein [Pyrinomonadaceae bacterium]|nr:transglycosylase SLT domain-containing protein [Pyrinomonadaceae bacterium]
MKRCPECRRDYYDDSLLYCLDDGNALLEGPASMDEPATAILQSQVVIPEAPTKIITRGQISAARTDAPPQTQNAAQNIASNRKWMTAGLLGVFLIAALGIGGYWLYGRGTQSIAVGDVKHSAAFYWQISEDEKNKFISETARDVQRLIGDEPSDLDQAAIRAIKLEIDEYVERKDSLSQKPFEEGLRTIYGRATQYAPLIAAAYDAHKIPPALGLYQAMIESEYRDCPTHPHPTGPVGLFQFSRKRAAQYGLTPNDYCDVRKQTEAAARHMSDLISDFGNERSSWTLALLSFNDGADQVRNHLRQMRAVGITERNFWAIRRYRETLQQSSNTGENEYVTRFFAAAIIGETPEAFELSTPPLTTLRPSTVR